MSNITMTEGITNNFNSCLRGSYNFYDNCLDSISKCKVLENLKIDNDSNNLLKNYINKQKNKIDDFSHSVQKFEEDILSLDQYCSIVLQELKIKRIKDRRTANEIAEDMKINNGG